MAINQSLVVIFLFCVVISGSVQTQAVGSKEQSEDSPITNIQGALNGNIILSLRQHRGLLEVNKHDWSGLCMFNQRVFKSGTTILDRGCNICKCNIGIVYCTEGPIQCRRRYQGEPTTTTTQPPKGCKFEKKYRYNGEVFLASDECNICSCQEGAVLCGVKPECENIAESGDLMILV